MLPLKFLDLAAPDTPIKLIYSVLALSYLTCSLDDIYSVEILEMKFFGTMNAVISLLRKSMLFK
jgi:hypothetical protein